MRWSRITENGDSFDFVTIPGIACPKTTKELYEMLISGLVKPDIFRQQENGETNDETIARLYPKLLAQIEPFKDQELTLTKNWAQENILRENINWIPTDQL